MAGHVLYAGLIILTVCYSVELGEREPYHSGHKSWKDLSMGQQLAHICDICILQNLEG